MREGVECLVEEEDIETACDLYLEGRRSNQVFHLSAEAQRRIAFWLEKLGRPVEAATAHLDYARFHRHCGRADHAMARAATLLATRHDQRGRALEILEETVQAFPESALRPLLEQEVERLQSAPLRRPVARPVQAG